MRNSPLVDYTLISPHKSPRTAPIRKITIHHMAGNATVEGCGRAFQGSREASANYGVDGDGRVGLYVPEDDRSWASSSRSNDNAAVTIEVANCGGAPDWPVSDKAYAKLIDLCVDVCLRNGIERLTYTGDRNGTLTMHSFFAATVCPGPYLKARFAEIAAEVNERLEEESMTAEKLAALLPEAFALLGKQEAAPWAKEALDWCRERGYMVGDGTGNQQPMKPLLRQEAAQMMMRIMSGGRGDE